MLKTLASQQSNKQLNLCLIYQEKNIQILKQKDKLIKNIKTKKDKLNIDLSDYGNKETDDQKGKTIFEQC